MDLLATVNMHVIHTSGNCIRNTTPTSWPVWPWTKWSIRAPTLS